MMRDTDFDLLPSSTGLRRVCQEAASASMTVTAFTRSAFALRLRNRYAADHL